MSEMEDKILGRVKKRAKPFVKVNRLTTDYIWQVSVAGCGTSLFNGATLAQMLDQNGRQKVLRGETHFESGIYEIELYFKEAK